MAKDYLDVYRSLMRNERDVSTFEEEAVILSPLETRELSIAAGPLQIAASPQGRPQRPYAE
jgi:hypothetical protein